MMQNGQQHSSCQSISSGRGRLGWAWPTGIETPGSAVRQPGTSRTTGASATCLLLSGPLPCAVLERTDRIAPASLRPTAYARLCPCRSPAGSGAPVQCTTTRLLPLLLVLQQAATRLEDPCESKTPSNRMCLWGPVPFYFLAVKAVKKGRRQGRVAGRSINLDPGLGTNQL
jgi:hypothetical protein